MTLACLSAGVWEPAVQAVVEAMGEVTAVETAVETVVEAAAAAAETETQTLLLHQPTARHLSPHSRTRSQVQLPSTRPLRTQWGLVLLAHLWVFHRRAWLHFQVR